MPVKVNFVAPVSPLPPVPLPVMAMVLALAPVKLAPDVERSVSQVVPKALSCAPTAISTTALVMVSGCVLSVLSTSLTATLLSTTATSVPRGRKSAV